MPVPDWPPGTLSEMVNPLDHLRYVPHHWPLCPTCGRWVHPDLWPGHVGSHETTPVERPDNDAMHRAYMAWQRTQNRPQGLGDAP